MAGDSSAIVHWDVGAADASGVPAPTNSMLQTSYGTTNSGTNQYGADPTFITEFDTSIALLPWRTNPNLIGAIMVAADVPPSLMGDYHIPTASVAKDNPNSAASVGSVAAPAVDIDGGARPTGTRFDLGADELPGTVVVAFPRTSVLDAQRPTAAWDRTGTAIPPSPSTESVEPGPGSRHRHRLVEAGVGIWPQPGSLLHADVAQHGGQPAGAHAQGQVTGATTFICCRPRPVITSRSGPRLPRTARSSARR